MTSTRLINIGDVHGFTLLTAGTKLLMCKGP